MTALEAPRRLARRGRERRSANGRTVRGAPIGRRGVSSTGLPTTHAIGRHQLVVDGDWVEMRFDGPIAGDESTALQRAIAGVLASTGGRAYLLADISGLKGLGTDNRQQMAEWHRKHRITAGAVFGGSFTVRVLVTLQRWR